MKQRFMKFLCCLLVMALLLPTSTLLLQTTALLPVYADTETEKEADATADALVPESAGNWWKAIFQDHLAWNYFHNQVEKHIRDNDSKMGKGELPIIYKDEKTGLPTGKTGRADLYKEVVSPLDPNTELTYIWEVKPASYSVETKKTTGEKQLKGYVDSGKPNYRIGNTDNINISGDTFDSDNGLYKITYRIAQNGLILYWFERKPDAPEPEPVPVPVPVPVPNPDPKLSPMYGQAVDEAVNYGIDLWGHERNGTSTAQPDQGLKYSKTAIKALVAAALAWEAQHAKVQSSDYNNTVSGEIVSQCNTFILAMNPIITNSDKINNPGDINTAIDDFLLAVETLMGENVAEELRNSMTEEDSKKTDELIKEIQKNSGDFDKAGKAQPPRDPLIVDLGESGIKLNKLENGVYFDLDNNGFAEKTAWIGAEDGFLALDRNGNGKIDNGGELFGDQVILEDGLKSTSGFEALAKLDENNDGIIDSNDSAFANLCIWIDANHNGSSESNEIKTLSELGIVSISCDHAKVSFVDPETGTRIAESADVAIMKNGVTTTTKISEFWFPINSSDTTQGGTVTAGNVPSIFQAITADESGKLFELWMRFNEAEDIALKHYYLKQILYFITDASDIPIDSRGGNIDARDLKVIEQFMGREFVGVNGTNPNAPAAEILKKVYANIENQYCNILNLQASLGGYLQSVYEFKDDKGQKGLDLSFLNYIIDSKISDGENVDTLVYDLGLYLKSFDNINGTRIFNDYSVHYSSISSHYDDIVHLTDSSNTFIGTDGADNFKGTNNIDYVFGENGNDTLYGGKGNDLIYGSEGNDTLNGGDGDDSYFVENNHGNDIIIDNSGLNKIIFTDGLDADDYTTSVNVMGFVLTNKKTGKTICLRDFLTNPLNYEFYFGGKAVVIGGGEAREVIQGSDKDDNLEAGGGFNMFYGNGGNDDIYGGENIDFMYGGDGDDTLLGRNGTNIIYGDAGNDTIYDGDDSSYLSGGDGDDLIYGGGGADVLDGGAGNDYLQGDHGDDTYIFKKGYGMDKINASSGINTIRISDLTVGQMINTRNAQNDLIIDFSGTNDQLVVQGFFNYNSNRNFNFVFDNGTVLGQYDVKAKYAPIYGTDNGEWLAIQNGDDGIIHGLSGDDGLSGGSGNDELYGDDGNDTLYGNDGNDILDGGIGNDSLNGGNGNDTYIFGKGYNNDVINDWGGDSIVRFKDINSDEVTISDQYGSNLVISIKDTNDTLIINGFKWSQGGYTFEFADGAVGMVNKNTWKMEYSKLPAIE